MGQSLANIKRVKKPKAYKVDINKPHKKSSVPVVSEDVDNITELEPDLDIKGVEEAEEEKDEVQLYIPKKTKIVYPSKKKEK